MGSRRICGRRLKAIACIEDRHVIRTILTHLNERVSFTATTILPNSQAPQQSERERRAYGSCERV